MRSCPPQAVSPTTVSTSRLVTGRRCGPRGPCWSAQKPGGTGAVTVPSSVVTVGAVVVRRGRRCRGGRRGRGRHRRRRRRPAVVVGAGAARRRRGRRRGRLVGGTVVVVAGGVVVVVGGASWSWPAARGRRARANRAWRAAGGAVELVVDAGVLEVVEEGTDATPSVEPPPVTTAGSTATGTVDGTAAAGAAGPNVGIAAADGAAAGTTADGVGRRTVGAARMLGAPSDAKRGDARSGAARPIAVGSDGAIGDGVRPNRGAEVVGVEAGSAAKPGVARRYPPRALSRSSPPTTTTSPDVSASAVLRGLAPTEEAQRDRGHAHRRGDRRTAHSEATPPPPRDIDRPVFPERGHATRPVVPPFDFHDYLRPTSRAPSRVPGQHNARSIIQIGDDSPNREGCHPGSPLGGRAVDASRGISRPVRDRMARVAFGPVAGVRRTARLPGPPSGRPPAVFPARRLERHVARSPFLHPFAKPAKPGGTSSRSSVVRAPSCGTPPVSATSTAWPASGTATPGTASAASSTRSRRSSTASPPTTRSTRGPTRRRRAWRPGSWRWRPWRGPRPRPVRARAPTTPSAAPASSSPAPAPRPWTRR